jgi:hypothetical protein
MDQWIYCWQIHCRKSETDRWSIVVTAGHNVELVLRYCIILMVKFTIMKILFCFILLFGLISISKSQTDKTLTLKEVLLNQLKTTHNKEDWFAPLNIAIEGLTPDQANWKEKGADHSIAELTTHLIFWNEDQLDKFLDQTRPAFSGNNNETFSSVDKDSWASTVKKADSVFIKWENAIAAADDKKLQAWYEIIANINTHNAYHTGQIVFIRKLQGSWNPAKGVK